MFREAIITHPVVVNDGKPFEAYGIEVKQEGKALISLSRKGLFVTVIRVDEIEQMEERKASLQWQLAQALNPPIRVTQAVLDAMKKQAVESKLLGGNVAHYKRYSDHGAWFSFYLWDVDMGWWCGYHNSYYTDEDLLMDYVQADCPLALRVLLGFTVEGVPV